MILNHIQWLIWIDRHAIFETLNSDTNIYVSLQKFLYRWKVPIHYLCNCKEIIKRFIFFPFLSTLKTTKKEKVCIYYVFQSYFFCWKILSQIFLLLASHLIPRSRSGSRIFSWWGGVGGGGGVVDFLGRPNWFSELFQITYYKKTKTLFLPQFLRRSQFLEKNADKTRLLAIFGKFWIAPLN